MINLRLGDCLEVMKELPANSVDSIVTDPPYGLSFMGKDWDHGVPGAHFWIEALRVAKPGAHLLAFGGTRTFHRLAVAIEDAGWEIRDCVMWVYGSGFPKSHNLKGDWEGWGTALKPAWEPIIVARKPFPGTVASNVLEWGTGAINVDGCRVGYDNSNDDTRRKAVPSKGWCISSPTSGSMDDSALFGRWPANFIHDGSEEVLALMPENKGAFAPVRSGQKSWGGEIYGKFKQGGDDGASFHGDGLGSAARFFYCAKASKRDRDEGCEGLEEVEAQSTGWSGESMPLRQNGTERKMPKAHNPHPTVKPTDLMRYLCRLVTPPGGVILDPFMGSGSTGKGAILEGFDFIGIDLNPEYVEIARRRIEFANSTLVQLQPALEMAV